MSLLASADVATATFFVTAGNTSPIQAGGIDVDADASSPDALCARCGPLAPGTAPGAGRLHDRPPGRLRIADKRNQGPQKLLNGMSERKCSTRSELCEKD